jgi:UDP:flavonoid glycosyltransferase YjiC (YdhE family)
MARVLCIWELGANLGHLSRLLVLAERLRAREHEVIFAVRDVHAAAPLLRERQFPFIAAPDMLNRSAPPRRSPRSYAEILEGIGFCDFARLIATMGAWRHLFSLLRPRVLLLDHSPAALLAARGEGIARILLGNGFSIPPRGSPMPDLRPWAPTPPKDLDAADRRVLEAVNMAFRKLGLAPFGRLHDLFEVEQGFLCTFSQLDHYRERESGARYWGPIALREGMSSPSWPPSTGPRILAYLQPSLTGFEELLARLAKAGASVLAHVPGLSDQTIARVSSTRVRIAKNPVDLVEARQSANLGVTHAGHGVTATLLAGGVPVLMFPQHIEQYLLARRVGDLGAGVIVERFDSSHDYCALVSRMVADERFLQSARRFAHEHREFESESAAEAMVGEVEAYL